jgi:hypothetical protein
LFGIGFALIARDRVRADGPFSSPAFPLVSLHAAAIVMPIALYFYAVHPAWAWMYFFDPAKMSGIAILPLMVGHAALVVAGWYVSCLLLRRGFQIAVLYSGGVIALTLLVLVVSGINRLATAADYRGWVTKTGVGVLSVKVGWAFIVSLLAIALSGVYVAIELNRDGRRVRAR